VCLLQIYLQYTALHRLNTLTHRLNTLTHRLNTLTHRLNTLTHRLNTLTALPRPTQFSVLGGMVKPAFESGTVPSYDVCLEVRGEIIRTVLCCVVY